jgi:hypothetical protein
MTKQVALTHLKSEGHRHRVRDAVVTDSSAMPYQQDGDPTQTVHHLNMPGRAAEVARCLDQSRPVGWRLRRWSRRLRVDRGSSTGVAESLGSVDMVRN